MSLLLIIALGLLFLHVLRKSKGPPPTLPGESPEFDKLLAEINEKWLFVFEEDGKIVLTDIYGQCVKVIANPQATMGKDLVAESIKVIACPGVDWAAVAYDTSKSLTGRQYEGFLALIDLRDYTVHPVTFDKSVGIRRHPQANPFWVSETTLAVPTSRGSWVSQKSRGGWETLYWMYDVNDLKHPESVRFPALFSDLDPEAGGMYDESSRTLVFVSTDYDRDSQEILAYDKDGLRPATVEEKERFDARTAARPQGNESESTGAPVVKVRPLKKHHSFDRKFPRLRWLRYRKYEIIVDGKRVKVTRYDPKRHYLEHFAYHVWNPDLQLIFFREWPAGYKEGWYYMDRYGHYRFWHAGDCIFKYRDGIKMGIMRPGKNE
jgi:hypothetical protein